MRNAHCAGPHPIAQGDSAARTQVRPPPPHTHLPWPLIRISSRPSHSPAWALALIRFFTQALTLTSPPPMQVRLPRPRADRLPLRGRPRLDHALGRAARRWRGVRRARAVGVKTKSKRWLERSAMGGERAPACLGARALRAGANDDTLRPGRCAGTLPLCVAFTVQRGRWGVYAFTPSRTRSTAAQRRDDKGQGYAYVF